MSAHIDMYGERRISKVEIQTWHDEAGAVEYELLYILSKTGEVFARDLLMGETAEAVKAYYETARWTDHRCLPV